MLSHRLKVAVGLWLTGNAVAFAPFADVEEFSPVPLAQHCDQEVKAGIRLCEGKTHRVLEDGGIVSLNWAMHADPDRILSLDTEHKHGVRVVKCTPSSLELVLPESHVRHAQVGELIVGSHFVHGCEHLMQQTDKEKEDDEPTNYNLYHRIVKVVSLEYRNADGSLAAGSSQGKMARAKVWTKELPSLGHAVGSIAYDFDYTPVEATDESAFPKRRTWDGDYNRGRWTDESVRRLNVDNQMPETFDAKDFAAPQDKFHSGAANPNADVHYRVDGGHPLFGGETIVSDDVQSLLNLQPKKVANFGWNWNFKLNASQDLSFNYTVPGNRMYVIIKKPYVKAHSKIRLRFRSYMPNENAEDTFFTDNTWVKLEKHVSNKHADIFEQWVPRVKWEATVEGHGTISAGVKMQMNAQMDVSSNPLELIQLPVLQQFWKPKWFGTINFNLGNLPVSLSPGIQFKAKFFHYGSFRGSLAVGIHARPIYAPKLQFDSFTGLRVDLHTKLEETTITPPNWMVSTRHFECGIALEPTIWIKGHLGQTVQDSKFAAALRPYFNMTITRAGHVAMPGEEQKELVIYPFRIIGLPVNSNKRYKVRIETKMSDKYCGNNLRGGVDANSKAYNAALAQQGHTQYSETHNGGSCEHYRKTMDSTEGLNFGEVEYHDPVGKFSFGLISQRMLMRLTMEVQVVEVDYSTGKAFERLSEKKEVKCKSIINGICQPSPIMEEITWLDGSTVKVFVHTVWKENPRPWFATRIRGVAASFPEVIVNKDYIQQVVPGFKIDSYANTGTVVGENVNKPLVLVLRHSFKSYPILIDQPNGYVPGVNSSSLTSKNILELGSSFLSTWDRTCITGTKQCDPKLVLYHGDTELATADIPRIPWNTREGMQGTYQSIFGSEAASSRVVPVSVALKPAYQNGKYSNWAHVGLVRMTFAIANPAAWNRWISPYEFTPVKVGSTFKLIWTLNEAHEGQATTFSLSVRKGVLNNVGASSAEQLEYLRPRIGQQDFEEITAPSSLSITPTINQGGGMHRNRFEHNIEFSGAAVGDTVMVSVAWNDKFGNTHTMYAPPFLIEAGGEVAAAAAQAPVAPVTGVAPAATGVTGRRLAGSDFTDLKKVFSEANSGWERGQDGDWKHKYHNQGAWGDDFSCTQKDLNFAFGAGIMFRAFVEQLSFPKDLPVLGAIQSAPQLGTPWEDLVAWSSSPSDLKSKLPALLCRHGVCSATLPGCPQYSDVKHYYPEITIQFRHTLQYPVDKPCAKNDQWVDALKTGLSYTFAVMPEAISMIMHYTNLTIENEPQTGPGNPVTPVPPVPTAPAPSHRRRYTQYQTLVTAEDACENHEFDFEQCHNVGCCKYDFAETELCHAGMAGYCTKPGDHTPLGDDIFGKVRGAEPMPALKPMTLPPTSEPSLYLPPLTTDAPGSLLGLLGRRLGDDSADTRGKGTHVQGITIKFKNGLRYQMDKLLMDNMIREGQFRDFEDVSSPNGEKAEVHLYAIRDSSSEFAQKASLPKGVRAVSQAPQQVLALSALVACALMGVAFVVRRVRSNYNQVQESSGPVE